MRSPRNNGTRSAFTLIEVIVSTLILSILVILMSQMLLTSESAWSHGEANKERMQNARAISDFIGNELRAALLPVGRTNTSSLQFVVNPTAIGTTTFNNHDAVFWQVPLATDQTLGDVAEVGYFVQWDTTNPANPHSQLCRFFANPGTGTTTNPNFLIYSNPSAWLSTSILQSVAPANQANSYQGLFAENILGLWTRCLDPYGYQITFNAAAAAFTNATFDSRQGYSYRTPPLTGPLVGVAACALPPVIEVSVATLDSQAAARLGPTQKGVISSLVTSSSDAGSFVTAAMSNSSLISIRSSIRSYQTRIFLPGSK
jgi:prepilin-type N-terminal cleavage/methylation domain-containing protein